MSTRRPTGWVLALAAAAAGVAASSRAQDRVPERFGTTVTSYVNVQATELAPDSSDISFFAGNNGALRYQTNLAGYGLSAPAHLPAGALVTYFELDYYDAASNGQVIASLLECNYNGTGCVQVPGNCGATATVCSDVAGMPNYAGTSVGLSPGVPVDNFLKRYFVAAGNTTLDGTTAISQVIIGYQLQVSPAPATATFADVPTDHPFFQYIEALSASGITGGCGGGNFCPNAPLTRGQMAVFLAKALGLEWQ
ncbi:MAG TPA: S-layer homology domain-containing protein [Thermoanaerobaculia bacterium]|jgi:hypothetical protein|nr:S-layer homology domain-containing protein [Thermoanaerobaculia bacterium]